MCVSVKLPTKRVRSLVFIFLRKGVYVYIFLIHLLIVILLKTSASIRYLDLSTLLTRVALEYLI